MINNDALYLLKKNKLVFFIPTLSGGGAERVVSELSLNFPASVEQHIVLFENKISYPYKGQIISLGLKSLGSQNFFVKPFEIFRRFLRFRKIVVELKPNAVISFLQANTINILVGLSLPFRKHKVIISERTATSKIDFIMKGLYGFVNRAVMKFVYRRADVIVAVSEHIKDELGCMFMIDSTRIKVIYNPIDVAKITRLSREKLDHPWFAQEVPVIVNVGRLSEQKNQKVLLMALSQIQKEKKCRLLIIGEGVLKEDLQRLAVQLRIDQDVLFLGYQQNPFVYMARSTIFCLSSSFEGFPNALAEAMAAGCPVIAFDCPSGPREILAPTLSMQDKIIGVKKAEYGILVENGNNQAMMAGIKMLLDNKALRESYARSGKTRALDFSPQKTINSYLEVCG